MMKLILLLALIIVNKCDSSSVVGRTGQDVTLPCRYDIKYYGALAVCWGKGSIPTAGCNNQLIATDGQKVIEGTRSSSKYQLLGRLDEGDVSLTILNVSEADAGQYGCRVEIPGWFNEDKHHHDLKVERVLFSTKSTLGRETSTQQLAASSTSGKATSTEYPQTSSFSSFTAEDESIVNVILVFVLFEFAALVMGVALIVTANRRQLTNPQKKLFSSTVEFIWTSSTLHPQSRGSAMKDVYQLNGGIDESDCDYCTFVTYYKE